MLFISFKEGFPKDHLHLARNVLNQLPVKFPANSVQAVSCNEVWNIGDRTFLLIFVQLRMLSAIQQLHLYAIVFQNVLASNQFAVVEDAMYNPLICYESSLWTKKQPSTFGSVMGKSSRLPYDQQQFWSRLHLLNIEWLQQNLFSLGLYNLRLKVRQWMLILFRDWHPTYYDTSHETYQSAVEIYRKIRIFSLSRWWVCDYHEEDTSWWNHGQGSHCRSIRQSTTNVGDWCLEILPR